MNTKLTLKLDKYVIEKAKTYASSHKRSLSKLIEAYLRSLVAHDDNKDTGEIEISPFVESLSSGINIPPDIDHKSEYKNHLTDKYK